jgi:hypothetical protein
MAFAGLVAAENLQDVSSAEVAWDNLGNGISYIINDAVVSGVVIKGADILALNGVSRVSARDLLLLRGLTSNAQTRLNTIGRQIASGVILQDNALLKDSPTSLGNYSLNGNLAFQSIRINNVPVQSLSSSPFSGDTATTGILLDRLIFTDDLTVQNVITSGTVNSPELALSIEDNGIVYYLKAGQS